MILSAISLLSSCNTAPIQHTKRGFAMDTDYRITIYGDSQSALTAAVGRLYELSTMFDYYDPVSESSRINATAYESPVSVSEDMGALIAEGLRLSEITGGAFGISLGLFIEPQGHESWLLLQNIGYENIVYDSQNRTVSFKNEYIKMHFGAIAKGFILDEVKKILHDNGVESAIIDIGGEIGVIGRSQRKDGIWRVGINDPYKPGEIITVHELESGVMATSGTYERGEHIIDPATGLAADSGLASVTVIAESGAVADALSTAIFVIGYENSLDLRIKTGVQVVLFEKK